MRSLVERGTALSGRTSAPMSLKSQSTVRSSQQAIFVSYCSSTDEYSYPLCIYIRMELQAGRVTPVMFCCRELQLRRSPSSTGPYNSRINRNHIPSYNHQYSIHYLLHITQHNNIVYNINMYYDAADISYKPHNMNTLNIYSSICIQSTIPYHQPRIYVYKYEYSRVSLNKPSYPTPPSSTNIITITQFWASYPCSPAPAACQRSGWQQSVTGVNHRWH